MRENFESPSSSTHCLVPSASVQRRGIFAVEPAPTRAVRPAPRRSIDHRRVLPPQTAAADQAPLRTAFCGGHQIGRGHLVPKQAAGGPSELTSLPCCLISSGLSSASRSQAESWGSRAVGPTARDLPRVHLSLRVQLGIEVIAALQQLSLGLHDLGLIADLLFHDLFGVLVGLIRIQGIPVEIKTRDPAFLRLVLEDGRGKLVLTRMDRHCRGHYDEKSEDGGEGQARRLSPTGTLSRAPVRQPKRRPARPHIVRQAPACTCRGLVVQSVTRNRQRADPGPPAPGSGRFVPPRG